MCAFFKFNVNTCQHLTFTLAKHLLQCANASMYNVQSAMGCCANVTMLQCTKKTSVCTILIVNFYIGYCFTIFNDTCICIYRVSMI